MKIAAVLKWVGLLGVVALLGALASIWPRPAPGLFGTQPVALEKYLKGDPSGVPSALKNSSLWVRGEYLTKAADCIACHSQTHHAGFSGGRAFKLPFGVIYSSNITPDDETGIGTWTDAEFLHAMHEGVGKHSQHLYPVFPYASYALLTDADVLAIKAYLRTLAPIHYRPPPNELTFPYNQRGLMAIWSQLYKPQHRFEPDKDHGLEWNRGAYLAEALGHCGECHTPRNVLQAVDTQRPYAGAVADGWNAYNLADPITGLRSWSAESLVQYLSTGHTPSRGTASGPMAEVVENSLRFLAADDVAAMGIYLRGLQPMMAGIVAAPVLAPIPSNSYLTLGHQVFDEVCASCHRIDGGGVQSEMASIQGSRSCREAVPLNVLQVIRLGSHLQGAQGAEVMPGFAKTYSEAQIAAVAAFVVGHCG